MKMKLEYGAETIEFTVDYRNRKTFGIRIEPPGNISVAAPKGARKEDVLRIVSSKANWITKKLYELEEREKYRSHKEYVNGESFMYLGINYPLALRYEDTVKKSIVELDNGKFYIRTNTKEQDKLKKAMEEWYRKRTLEKVTERIEHFQPYFKVKPNLIKVKEQKTIWASCTSRRNMNFNWRCSMAPESVLDYIVVHEMCHLVHMNHSSDFWNLVEKILPDYKEQKEWLKKYGVSLDL